MIIANFKRHYINDNFKNKSGFYLSIPLDSEKILQKFKIFISQINKYIEDSDFLYIVGKQSDSLTNTKEESDIILCYDIINEQDKIWSDIVSLHLT